MARIRTIKPEFFVSEAVGACGFGARLFFIGLWTVADRDGRLRWQPRKLKAQLFPYDGDLDLDALTAELVGAGLVRFYTADDGEVCAWIPGFGEHQRPHPKEPDSALPAWSAERAVEKHGEPWKNTASREKPGCIPSSPVGREGKGMDKGKESPGRAPGAPAASPSAPLITSSLTFHQRHGGHLPGFCDWVCLPTDLAEQFATRASWDVGRVSTWASSVRTAWTTANKVPSERMYDFWSARWAEAHPVRTVASSLTPAARFRASQAAKGGLA